MSKIIEFDKIQDTKKTEERISYLGYILNQCVKMYCRLNWCLYW